MVRYDDLLNGGAAAPAYADTVQSAPLPSNPASGRTDGAASTFSDNPRTVLLVWFALLALLVISHVVTLPVQR